LPDIPSCIPVAFSLLVTGFNLCAPLWLRAANSACLSTVPARVPMLLKLTLTILHLESRSTLRNMNQKVSEVPKKSSEFSNMTTAEFAQFAMQERVAPRTLGPVKVRLPFAQSVLGRRGWTANRVRDLWYLDPRASAPSWEEITDLEQLTGLQYARQELRTNDQLISQADALLEGVHEDFHRPFVAAFRAFFGALDRSRTQGD
jgi:hypothetical protein